LTLTGNSLSLSGFLPPDQCRLRYAQLCEPQFMA